MVVGRPLRPPARLPARPLPGPAVGAVVVAAVVAVGGGHPLLRAVAVVVVLMAVLGACRVAAGRLLSGGGPRRPGAAGPPAVPAVLRRGRCRPGRGGRGAGCALLWPSAARSGPAAGWRSVGRVLCGGGPGCQEPAGRAWSSPCGARRCLSRVVSNGGGGRAVLTDACAGDSMCRSMAYAHPASGAVRGLILSGSGRPGLATGEIRPSSDRTAASGSRVGGPGGPRPGRGDARTPVRWGPCVLRTAAAAGPEEQNAPRTARAVAERPIIDRTGKMSEGSSVSGPEAAVRLPLDPHGDHAS